TVRLELELRRAHERAIESRLGRSTSSAWLRVCHESLRGLSRYRQRIASSGARRLRRRGCARAPVTPQRGRCALDAGGAQVSASLICHGMSGPGPAGRKIVHVDMDAFYASVEQRDRPELAGLPLVVAGSGPRSVVVAASYPARKFGVHSALPMSRALRLCPELIVVAPRFDVYRKVSRQIRQVFLSYTDLVEPLALDEAYLDVTEPKKGPSSATLTARAIKADILQITGLTASAGVAAGKFLAKIASGLEKPDGLTVITPERAQGFLDSLPVEKFFGVGPRTAQRLRSLGIQFGRDIRSAGRERLEAELGKAGASLHAIANGHDDRPVEPNRPRKSISSETTFDV